MPCNSFAGELNKEIKLYFSSGSVLIDQSFANNRLSLSNLSDLLKTWQTDTLMTIDRIEIKVQTSIDGGVTRNKDLRQRRVESVRNYLATQFNVPDSMLRVLQEDTMWDEFRELVEASKFEGREDILEIVDNTLVEVWGKENENDKFMTLLDSRLKRLMEYNYGDTYRLLTNMFFSSMRYALIRVVYKVPDEEEVIYTEEVVEVVEAEPVAESELVEYPVETQTMYSEPISLRNPILAIKTNLAGLGVGVASLGLEVPIKDKFSAEVQAYYSPYTIKQDWKIKMLVIQPEFRYWFGDALKGHFVGVHAHWGVFNMALDQWSRYQNSSNSPIWGGGIGYGYDLYISKALNIEFNIGVGYASLSYDTFYNVDNGAQYNHTDKGYWGITRFGISISYIINHK